MGRGDHDFLLQLGIAPFDDGQDVSRVAVEGLKVRAAFARRHEAEGLELGLQITGRGPAAARAGGAPFEGVISQRRGMLLQLVGRNCFGRAVDIRGFAPATRRDACCREPSDSEPPLWNRPAAMRLARSRQ